VVKLYLSEEKTTARSLPAVAGSGNFGVPVLSCSHNAISSTAAAQHPIDHAIRSLRYFMSASYRIA
jgi:hypothetical protein